MNFSKIARFGRGGGTGRNILLIGMFSFLLPGAGWAVDVPAGDPVKGTDLHLKDYITAVLAYNENVQAQMLGAEADRHRYAAEYGIFEPNFVGNAGRVANHRQNNNEQVVSQNGVLEYKERNNLYDAGIESLLPTGGKIRLGYSLSDLGNTLSPVNTGFGVVTTGAFTSQYQSFAGVSFTQPLLKNGGVDVTYGKIRLAALQSDIGFQQYRRQLMLTVSQAEAAYWGLYFSQEQLKFVTESLHVAETVLADSKALVKAGKGAEIEVLQAESGVALRRTKKNEAVQKYYDAISQMLILRGTPPECGDKVLNAIDYPDCVAISLSYPDSCQSSFALNPDYLIQKKKLDEETVRLGIARNLALPEFNLKTAYGYNGLGGTTNASSEAVQSWSYPSWSIGFEVRVPMFGGVEGRNDLKAAKLTQKQAQVNLQGIGVQLTNSVKNSIQKYRSILETVRDYEKVVKFREDLMNNELARLEAGKVEAHRVLEVEAELFEARQSLAEAQVQYQRALLELQLAEGTILKKRNLEITRNELRQRMIAMVKEQVSTGEAQSSSKK